MGDKRTGGICRGSLLSGAKAAHEKPQQCHSGLSGKRTTERQRDPREGPEREEVCVQTAGVSQTSALLVHLVMRSGRHSDHVHRAEVTFGWQGCAEKLQLAKIKRRPKVVMVTRSLPGAPMSTALFKMLIF